MKLRIWKFPPDWTEREIQHYLVPYTLGRVVNGRYVLWWPTGEDVDDERERFSFEMHQRRILMLFERMELEGGS